MSSRGTRRLLIALACALGCVGSGDDAPLNKWAPTGTQTSAETPLYTEHDVITRARALRARGSLMDAETLLTSAMSRLPAPARASAHGLLGRMALGQGKTAKARTELQQGMLQQRALGVIPAALADGFALTFLEAEVAYDLQSAELVLDTLETVARDNPEDRAALAHHRALVAYKGDEPRRALALLAQARAEPVTRLPPPLARAIRTLHGSVLASVGRFADARALATEVVELSFALGACERSDAHASRGWFALLARLSEVSGPAFAQPQAHTDFLSALAGAERCEDPRRLGHAMINLALSLLIERADVPAAERALARFEALALEGGVVEDAAELHVWALEARGRIRFVQGRFAEAHQAFARELALAEAAGNDAWAYRALVGIGREQLARGEHAPALAAFQGAEQRLQRLVALTPLSAGHDAFFAQRQDAAQGVVESLLALERVEEAERAARMTLSRATAQASLANRMGELTEADRGQLRAHLGRYRQLRDELDSESREDWRLSSEALIRSAAQRSSKQAALFSALDAAHAVLSPTSPPEGTPYDQNGATTLTFFPALDQARTGRWWLFLRDGHQARFLTLHVHAGTLANELGRLLTLHVAEATRVALHVHPAFPLPDLHTTRIAGSVWNARAEVTYAQGLAQAPSSLAAATATHIEAASALVVLDPTGTLEGAEQEGQLVKQALEAQGVKVLMRTAKQATRSRLLLDLGSVSHLHFAGHARPASDSGLGAALVLTQGQSLSAFDVLGLEHAPAQVVLSACGAGASESATLSLARAFLAQGSHEVMAATRAVADADAARIMQTLYAELSHASSLTEAFQRAVARLEQQPAIPDWSAFRIFVR